MSEGPTIGGWTQYGWIPDDASSFPARVRLRDAALMVYYEPDAKFAKLKELLLHMHTCMGNVDADGNHECFSCEYEGAECDFDRRMRELGVEVDE